MAASVEVAASDDLVAVGTKPHPEFVAGADGSGVQVERRFFRNR